MDKYKKLGNNVGLMFIGNFVTKILSFFMVPLYTSVLSTSDYGTADMISTTVLLVLPIFSMLMDEAILRFALDKSNDPRQVFSIAMRLSTWGFLVAMLFSPLVLLLDAIKDYYVFVVLYYVSSWLYNLFSNYAKGLERVELFAIAGILHSILFIAMNLLSLLVLKWGIYGYLLSISCSNFAVVIFLFFICKLYKCFLPSKKQDRNLAKAMTKYSVPMIPDYLTWWVNNAADRYVLEFFCTTSAVGIYSIAYRIPTLLNSITAIFSSAWRISSVEDFGSEESVRFYSKTYKVYSACLLIGSASLILATKLIAKVLFAKEFFVAWKITPILLLANIFSAQAIFAGSIFTASKQTKMLFIGPLIGGLVNITLNILLIPKFEGMGAAIATAIGYFVILSVNTINTRKLLPMKFNCIKNGLGYLFIIGEILAIFWDCWQGYVIASILTLVILIMNSREFVEIVKNFFRKLKHKQKGKENERRKNNLS